MVATGWVHLREQLQHKDKFPEIIKAATLSVEFPNYHDVG
jgi:hypothetical protein